MDRGYTWAEIDDGFEGPVIVSSMQVADGYVAIADIAYTLPAYAPVTLKLYNAMMQEVATVVDEPKEAGEHHVTLDAGALPSGVYYYRLSTGASSLTRRMVVVK
jgi:hypothetical protein